jgi:histidine triad (HIT) family protein
MADRRNVEWTREDWYCHGVLDGTLAVERIFEDDETVAFYAPSGHQLNDEYDTHVYVIPKRHIPTVLDLTPEDAGLVMRLMQTIQIVAEKLDLDERGFYIRANVMPPYQHTGHIHIHLLSGEH